MEGLKRVMDDMTSITALGRHRVYIDKRNVQIRGSCCIGYAKGETEQKYFVLGSRGKFPQPAKYYPYPTETKEIIPEDYINDIRRSFKDWARNREWGKETKIVDARIDDRGSSPRVEFKICL